MTRFRQTIFAALAMTTALADAARAGLAASTVSPGESRARFVTEPIYSRVDSPGRGRGKRPHRPTGVAKARRAARRRRIAARNRRA